MIPMRLACDEIHEQAVAADAGTVLRRAAVRLHPPCGLRPGAGKTQI